MSTWPLTSGGRLAYWIPIAPWPVLLAIASQGEYGNGAHGAEALYSVGVQALLICLAAPLLALSFIWPEIRRKNRHAFRTWLAFAGFNTILMVQYVLTHAIAYA